MEGAVPATQTDGQSGWIRCQGFRARPAPQSPAPAPTAGAQRPERSPATGPWARASAAWQAQKSQTGRLEKRRTARAAKLMQRKRGAASKSTRSLGPRARECFGSPLSAKSWTSHPRLSRLRTFGHRRMRLGSRRQVSRWRCAPRIAALRAFSQPLDSHPLGYDLSSLLYRASTQASRPVGQ